MLRLAPFLLFVLLVFPALAEPPAPTPEPVSDNPYSVSGVEVDVKGSSGVNARDKAFTEGGRKALKTLATRLSGVNEPDLAGIDDNGISRLIKSFEVEKEKVSGSRYIGKLTFHFKPEATDLFLETRGLGVRASDGPTGMGAAPAYASAPTLRTVVLPIVRLKTHSILWEEKTSWARAWENYLSDHPDPNFVVPEGMMEDISTISTTEALGGIPIPLSRIMQKYEARAVLIAVLVADSPSPEPNMPLSVQLANFDSRGALRGTSSFTLPAQPQRRAMDWLQDGAAYAAGFVRQQSDKVLASLPPGIIPQSTPAVARPFGFLQLDISVPYSNVSQWQKYRTSLQEIDNVMRLDVKSLTHSQAMIQITYRGMRTSLDAALAEKGLRLDEIAPDRLILVPSIIVTQPLSVSPPIDNEEGMEEDEEEESIPSATAPVAPLSPPGPPVDKPSRIR
jgi:hypothetical protein